MQKYYIVCVSETGIRYNFTGPINGLQNAKDYLRGMAHCNQSTLNDIEQYLERDLEDGKAFIMSLNQ